LRTLEAFTGRAITADVVREKINHPSNAFNVQNDAHESFDKRAWGIQALQQPGGEVSHIIFYRFYPLNFLSTVQIRRVVRDGYAATVHLKDGDEIVFRKGVDDAPDPSFCHLKLAHVCRWGFGSH